MSSTVFFTSFLIRNTKWSLSLFLCTQLAFSPHLEAFKIFPVTLVLSNVSSFLHVILEVAELWDLWVYSSIKIKIVLHIFFFWVQTPSSSFGDSKLLILSHLKLPPQFTDVLTIKFFSMFYFAKFPLLCLQVHQYFLLPSIPSLYFSSQIL